MEGKYEYFKLFGWSKNPFTLTVSPDLMVGYSQQTEQLLSHVFNQHKAAMIIGPTGAGKTTILLWLKAQLKAYNNFKCYYVPKPPASKEDLIKLFKHTLGYTLLDKILYKEINVNNLPKYINKKTNKKTVFLVDEAHECSQEVLEWLRTINDLSPNLIMIFAGLNTFEKKLEVDLPTLLMRINTRVYLESLSEMETESLIQKRIDRAGGQGIKPFTQDAVKKIYQITGGFPREIIKVCDQLVKEAASRNLTTINSSLVEEIFSRKVLPKSVQIKFTLTPKQKEILELLNKKPDLSPTEIVESIDTKDYKTKEHAIRSVNNILKRLMDEDLIKRVKVANKYVYSLSGKAKTLLAEA
ncbi:MAG: AAA family ATPase [Candidatus Aenigmarchaeota archaeon]|nr:AAA family ATPase [Candidatus Aenigmarchaeota archaeon]MCX8179176.1 AAA family ATPase [Candidatus Aenigmarchaeota archaeon]